MTRLLNWFGAWLAPLQGEGGYFGGGLPVHNHSSSSSGGTGVVGTYTAGTPLIQNPYAVSVTVTQAHGLGAMPTRWESYLECLTAEFGYSIGNRINFIETNGAGVSSPSGTIAADATNLVLTTPSGGQCVTRKDTRAVAFITVANWKLVCTPYKLN